MTYSIIILSYNKSACTRRCLESLLTSADGDWEAVLVDNGSTDDTEGVLRGMKGAFDAREVRLELVMNNLNLGCSTGRNQGIDRGRGEWLVFLDNDMQVGDPRWLSKLRATIETTPNAGAAGPKLVFADNPAVIQFAGGAISRTGRPQFIGRGEPADDARFNARREVQFFITACLMTTRAVIDRIGAFDEAFNPVQFEDIDFCYRARSQGFKVIYDPAVTMLHDESATTAGSPALNNPYIVVKHGLLFKERWRHLFEKENGPADEEIRWKKIGRFKKS